MHSSIGTGSLAYVVGSKVMDVRTYSKDGRKLQDNIEESTCYDNNVEVGKCYDRSNICTEEAKVSHWNSSNDGVELVSLRVSTDNVAYDSSGQQNSSSPKSGREDEELDYVSASSFDFPHLSVTDMFENSGKYQSGIELRDKLPVPEQSIFEDESMHSFRINNNVDLVIESNSKQPLATLHPMDSEIGIASPDEEEPGLLSKNQVYQAQMVNQLKISDVPQPAMIRSSISQAWPVSEERVSEWLWTLHRIGT